jgi:hypothetical protein
MKDNEMFVNAAKAAQEMQDVLVKNMERKDLEYCFKFGCASLSSLLASFIDGIFKNANPDKKQEFVEELIKSTKMLLHVKNLIRDNNVEQKH